MTLREYIKLRNNHFAKLARTDIFSSFVFFYFASKTVWNEKMLYQCRYLHKLFVKSHSGIFWWQIIYKSIMKLTNKAFSLLLPIMLPIQMIFVWSNFADKKTGRADVSASSEFKLASLLVSLTKSKNFFTKKSSLKQVIWVNFFCARFRKISRGGSWWRTRRSV